MRRAILIALCLLALALPSWAFTERYVTDAATGGGIGTEGDPWTLAEALNQAVDGDRVNILSDGPYSLGVTTVTDTAVLEAVIVFRGYNSAIGDLEGQGRNADGTLDTTNYPAITLTGTLTPTPYTFWQNLNFSGSLSSALFGNNTVDNFTVVSCKFSNTASNSSASAFACDNNVELIDCDFEVTNATSGDTCTIDVDLRAIGCRFTSAATGEFGMSVLRSALILNCVFLGTGGIKIEVDAQQTTIAGCTGSLSEKSVEFANATQTVYPVIFINNHFTDSSIELDVQYTVVDYQVIRLHNRTRDNTSPNVRIADGIEWGNIDDGATGTPATDYVNAGAGNVRLISGAPGESAGLIAYEDIGAYQREASAGGTTIIIVED